MKTIKIAQIDPLIKFYLPEPIVLKANKKYVFVINKKKMTLNIEPYWWFRFKNLLIKIFSSRR